MDPSGWTSSASTRSARSRSTRSRRPSRAPGHADGRWRPPRTALAAIPALRSRGSPLAQPRSVRAVQRPRLDAAVQPAPPDRREGRHASYEEETGALAVTLDDIKTFRQAGSRCPGHPEYGWTSGRGDHRPAGAGVGMSVGMATAGRWLAATYNRPGFDLFDYNVYVFCGDGGLMEGLSCEAASLAATSGSPTFAGSTTTTGSPSRGPPPSPSPKTSRPGSSPTAGMSPGWATPTISTC